MNDKNQKMLELLSFILGVEVDKLLDVMISKYVDNLSHKEFIKLEDALEVLKQEELNTWVSNQLED